jgi:hypothetical protein
MQMHSSLSMSGEDNANDSLETRCPPAKYEMVQTQALPVANTVEVSQNPQMISV